LYGFKFFYKKKDEVVVVKKRNDLIFSLFKILRIVLVIFVLKYIRVNDRHIGLPEI